MSTKIPGDPAESRPDDEVSRVRRPVAPDDLIRGFVEHWGVMARSWGINASMGELFALLYVTGSDWTAEELRERLQVSRGNVSMNLRELISWGVVHKVHRQGERREFYRAEDEVWTLFRRIIAERKRRELDPTLRVLRKTVAEIPDGPEQGPRRDRLIALQEFFALMNVLASRLITLDADELIDLGHLFEAEHRPRPHVPSNPD